MTAMTKKSFDIDHVMMTTDAVGGVWTYSLELAKGLARQGVRVTLVSMGPEPSTRQREEALQITNLELHAIPHRLEWMEDCWEDVDRAGDWLLALAEQIQPDVVHLNGYGHVALPWPAPTLVVCHSDVLSWYRAVRGQEAPVEQWGEYARRVKEGLQSAGLVVAPTSTMLREIIDIYGPLDSARVVYNGRSASAYTGGAKRNIVFAAGRFWDEAKNLSALMAVAPQLEWPVYLAGDVGEMPPRTTSVNLLGRLCPSAMEAWLGRASIYALPAKYEPFGLSVLEAAMAGCALVLGDIPTLRELWDDVAVFVRPTDPQALQVAIQELITDETRRLDMARRAQERALDYSAIGMVCGTLFAYQDLVQSNLLNLGDPAPFGVTLR